MDGVPPFVSVIIPVLNEEQTIQRTERLGFVWENLTRGHQNSTVKSFVKE